MIVTKFKGVEIKLDEAGVFRATMAEENLQESTLEALKKKITTRVDGSRKYAIPIWLLRITGTDWDDDDEPEVTLESLVFAGVSFHTGQLRFKDPTSGKAVKVQDRYSYRDEGFMLVLPRPGGEVADDVLDQIRLALDALKVAKESIAAALGPLKEVGEELVSHYQPSVEKEADLAERLGGERPHPDDHDRGQRSEIRGL